jgi:hypothetical protein
MPGGRRNGRWLAPGRAVISRLRRRNKFPAVAFQVVGDLDN